MTLLHRVELSVFADYRQFYLWDGGLDLRAPEDWTDLDVQRAVKVGDSLVVVCPIRSTTVPVTVEVLRTEPAYRLAAHDHAVICNLHLPTGCLQLHECTGGEKLRLSVTPGTYCVLVVFSDLASLSEDGLDGNDHYYVSLWPGPSRPLQVLKQWQGV